MTTEPSDDRTHEVHPTTPTADRSPASGFTLIELLVVVAVIGVLSAVVIPNLLRAVRRAHLTRFAHQAKTLREAFLRYYIDNSLFPSTLSPPERAFDRATLEPLVSGGYIKNAKPILALLDEGQVTAYDSPNVDGADSEFWAILALGKYNSIQVVIADTTDLPGFEGEYIGGVFWLLGDELYPIEQDLMKLGDQSS